jgi:hypothetical protein
MEQYIKGNISDITYMCELTPHLFSIQVFFIKSLNKIKGAGFNSHKQSSDSTENDLRRFCFRKSCAH